MRGRRETGGGKTKKRGRPSTAFSGASKRVNFWLLTKRIGFLKKRWLGKNEKEKEGGVAAEKEERRNQRRSVQRKLRINRENRKVAASLKKEKI